MRRLQLGALALTLPALALAVVLSGCGPKENATADKDKGKSAEKDKDKGAATGDWKAVAVKDTGTLTGKVALDGTVDTDALTKQLLGQIDTKKEEKEYCLSSKNPEDKIEQMYKVGANKQVGNVFVWVEPAESKHFFSIPEDVLKKYKDTTVDMHQPYCMFHPHCAVLFSRYRDPNNPKNFKMTGQQFVAYNDAKRPHNAKISGGVDNPGENPTLPPGESTKAWNFKPSTTPIKIECGIHPWMEAWARAYDHPYATLSVAKDPDDKGYGSYKIDNVPAGVKLRVVAWHERAGYLDKGSSGQEVELKKGESKDVDFKLKPK